MSTLAPALRSEYRKLVTTRVWWLLLIVMAAYMAFLAGVLAFTASQAGGAGAFPGSGTGGAEENPFADSPATAISVYTVSVALGYVFPVIVGALSVTGELRHQTITPTFLAEPNRTRVLVAKLVAAVPVGLVFGAVGVLSGVAAGAGVLALTGSPTYLTDPDVLVALGRSVLALAVWTVLGVGLGAAIGNQVAAIVVVLAFTQFVEPVVRSLLALVADGALVEVSAYLPGAAGEAVTGSSIYSALGMGALLSWWQGLLVLLAYAVVLAAVGRLTTFRRDVT